MFRSSSKKKQDIMEKGKELFWKHGFKRVSIEEVCSEANVSKMTFYKFFPNKMELVKTILQKVIAYSMKQYNEIMDQDIPFSRKVELQVQMKMEGTADISKEFMDDMVVHADTETKQMMQELSAKAHQTIYNSYIQAQKEGHIRKDVKPEFIMYFMKHMFEMVEDETLLGMYESTSEMATSLMKFFFYGILDDIPPEND